MVNLKGNTSLSTFLIHLLHLRKITPLTFEDYRDPMPLSLSHKALAFLVTELSQDATQEGGKG